MSILGTIASALCHSDWREASIQRRLQPHLPPGASILDIGAGSCKLAKRLAMRGDLDVTAVDVVDHKYIDFPLKLYDGTRLPFADNQFDISILVFALHHALDPRSLLLEATRVTRSALLIVEDSPRNSLERRLWRAWDYSLNHESHSDILVAHEAMSIPEWDRLLRDASLSPRSAVAFRLFFPVLCSYRHALFHVPLQRH
jgi:SAM-dependent methyltransferase